ncbi:MAG: histidinol dehydrogenase [Clostridiales bacterium]|nr:histidinol dehydrogenase [Clostridiales bacterium]
MITISKFSKDNERYQALLDREQEIPAKIMETVDLILADVKENGDYAVKKYMKQIDNANLDEIGWKVTKEEFEEAKNNIDPELAKAIREACDNIYAYHKNQLPKEYTQNYDWGTQLTRKYVPLSRIAVTVPGNISALVSTLYMSVIPAKVAGVPDINIMTKPKNGKIDANLLYAADYLGVNNVYKICGVQGIAAFAYGTEIIERVDAIVGPGNNYTQMAKKRLFGTVRIDSIAGPSEIVIIADQTANPRFVAADLLSQAEHGTGFEASTALVFSEEQALAIQSELETLVAENNLTIVQKALNAYGNIFIVSSMQEAIDIANNIAPEHVELMTQNPETIADKITKAGTIFIGSYSPEPVGDYYCGTNHILPTCGTARFSSGLSVNDFMRGYSVINYAKESLHRNSTSIERLATSEHMTAHALSIRVRSDYTKQTLPQHTLKK